MFRHILIPTDGSALSKKAVTNEVKFAQSIGAKVTGFFAAPPTALSPTRISCPRTTCRPSSMKKPPRNLPPNT